MGIVWPAALPPQAAVAELDRASAFVRNSREVGGSNLIALNFCYFCFLLLFTRLCPVFEHRTVNLESERLDCPSHGGAGSFNGCTGHFDFNSDGNLTSLVRILAPRSGSSKFGHWEYGGSRRLYSSQSTYFVDHLRPSLLTRTAAKA
jgi:hypothetical protein